MNVMRTFLMILAVFGVLIAGYGELERRKFERVFRGMDEYKAMQAEIDAESDTGRLRPKTATIGSVMQ